MNGSVDKHIESRWVKPVLQHDEFIDPGRGQELTQACVDMSSV